MKMRSGNFEIDNGILTGYTGEEAYLQIPEGVHTIGERAFHNCRSLREVTIPEGVRTIDPEAFQLCANLTEIRGGEGITRIGRDAFAGTPWYRRYAGNETGWDPSEGEFKMVGRVLVRAKRNIRLAEIP
ncbi:MAG: leucine-rich repeat domain-containing protein, partial [Firmicutes bacterium]|nr:leucine-rich repeat domain-containing protein [Bacillota bacterium]